MTADDLYSKSEKYFDYREKLKDIAAPTLIMVGEHDWICPLGNLLIHTLHETIADVVKQSSQC